MKIKKSKYNYVIAINDECILFNTRTLSIVGLDEAEKNRYMQICDGEECDDEFYQELYKVGVLIDWNLDERKILKHRLQKSRYSKEELCITIAPTLGCNFACPYCYQRQGEVKNSDLMDEKTQQALINFIKAKLSGDCKKLSVLWYGGEPLLGFKIIRKVSWKLMEMCEKLNVTYEASMITNGYLLDKFSPQEFREMNINEMQITLDGGKDEHDKRRVLKSNEGTFEKIVKNIQLYSKFISISVRVNVDRENEKGIYKLVEEFSNRNINNVSLYVAPVTNNENPDDIKCFKSQEFSNIFNKFEQKMQAKGMKENRSNITGCAHYCDADFVNAYVIDNVGNIYKCWSDIGNSSYCVGNILSGKQKNPHVYYEYMAYDPTEDEKCMDCEILPLCMGGCPYNRVNNIDRCSIYKYLLEDIIIRKYSEKI